MKKLNVLFLWRVEPELKRHLRKELSANKNINLIFPETFSKKNLLMKSVNAQVIVGWRATAQLLEASKNLKLFINPGTGVKHHIELFRKQSSVRNIPLVNGHGHSYSVAQHAVSMLLCLMNRIIAHHEWMKKGIWRTSDNKDVFSASIPLRNRKIGLMGYGAINKNVHKFLSGFDNEFYILKRKLTPVEKKKRSFFEVNHLNEFLKAIDILIIAVPHTSKTDNLIDAHKLKLLGKNGLLVNVARGNIVNEKDLYEALKKGTISGAAIDVWYNYSPKKDRRGREFPFDYPFHKLKNLVMSPHRAASPFNDLQRWDEVIENLKRAAAGRTDFLNLVDLGEEY